MKKLILVLLVALAPIVSFGQTKNWFETIASSNDLTVFARTIALGFGKDKALILAKEQGPFTIFAPNNLAWENEFGKLQESIWKSAGKNFLLENLSNYYIVRGNYDFEDLKAAAKAGGGNATLTNLRGMPLNIQLLGDNTISVYGSSQLVTITANGVRGSNGVVHILNKILVPNDKLFIVGTGKYGN